MEQKQVVVVAVCIHQDGKLLCTRRSLNKTFLPGKWEIPGGHVEYGETPEECIRREIMEELNIEVENEKLFAVTTYVRDDNGKQAFALFYTATPKSLENLKIQEEEVAEWAWLDADDIKERHPENDYTRCILQAYEEIK